MKCVDQYHSKQASLYLGDSAEVLQGLPDNSIDLITTSPPFMNLYVYSASERDVGNVEGGEEFFAHYSYIAKELLRLLKPGRLCCIHAMDVPTLQYVHGYQALRPFTDDLVRFHIGQGWNYIARIAIQTNPQAHAVRNHSRQLLFVQLQRDRSWLRPALPQQILVFRKAGENLVPITGDTIDRETWIDWAAPCWLGIRETDTLNVEAGRGEEDEKHVCPLAKGIIERCVRLWSNPHEVVLDPFAGLASVGHVAIQHKRRFCGVELKASYFSAACSFLRDAERLASQPHLFSELEGVL